MDTDRLVAALEADDREANEEVEAFVRLQRTFGTAVLIELASIIGFVVVSLIIADRHVKQATGVGFTLTLVLLGLLIVGVADARWCMSLYAELRATRRRRT